MNRLLHSVPFIPDRIDISHHVRLLLFAFLVFRISGSPHSLLYNAKCHILVIWSLPYALPSLHNNSEALVPEIIQQAFAISSHESDRRTCVEVKREYYQNSSVLDCVTQCSQSAAHLCEQFLQVQQIGFVTLGPLRCAQRRLPRVVLL